jgi:3-oxoacyl-[acyl-carrier protein] reductase
VLLKGKNAVITGCLKGIGRATMELFAKNGANIWACCQYQDAQFDGCIDNLQENYGVRISPLFFDLTEYEQIKNAVKKIIAAKEPVDVLVNIAGMTQDALFHMVSMEQMKRVFEVNFFSQMLLTQYITRLMLRQKSGSVINISSITGMDGNPGQLSYSASKAAMIGATKTLSAELAPSGIRVNAVAPGVIKTDMTEGLPGETIDRMMNKSSLKHLGLAAEVGDVIVFLASDLSSYITGQIIRVDGGIG